MVGKMEKKWRKNWEKGKLSRGRVNILGKGKASFLQSDIGISRWVLVRVHTCFWLETEKIRGVEGRRGSEGEAERGAAASWCEEY